MIGVLIVAGIIGYAMVYSGVSALGVVAIEPVTTLKALWPNGPGGTAPKVTAKDFPKPVGGSTAGASGHPQVGRA